MTRGPRELAGLVVLTLGIACPDPPDEIHCAPCDPYVILRDADALEMFAPLPEAASHCHDASISDDARERWDQRPLCELQEAHAVLATMDWSDGGRTSWRRLANDTFACKQNVEGATGCGRAGSGPHHDIVGPIDIVDQPQHHTGIALLVAASELAEVSEAALAKGIVSGATGTLNVLPGPALECSAFLVAADLVLTARHCIPEYETRCSGDGLPAAMDDWVLLFDYTTHPHDATQVSGISLLECGVGSGDPATYDAGEWALLAIPAQNERTIVELEPARPALATCEDVYTCGHPLGHPQVCLGSRDAEHPSTWIREIDRTTEGTSIRFRYTVDSMTGLSGAAVFDLGGNAIALHIAGEQNSSTDVNEVCSTLDGNSRCFFGRATTLPQIAGQIAEYLD